jgi:hypothetical protein
MSKIIPKGADPRKKITVLRKRQLKTFSEFVELAEKYYKPTDKLPSGNTPLKKATEKAKTNSKITKDKLHDVKRGADNPNFNDKPHKDWSIMSDDDGNHTIHHRTSGVHWNVTHTGHDKKGRKIHSLEWGHQHKLSKDTPMHKRVKIFRDASKIGDEVISRLPHGSVAQNSPVGKKRETHYDKHYNWGKAQKDPEYGDKLQIAKVTRNPSPKQRANRTKISPLKPEHIKHVY